MFFRRKDARNVLGVNDQAPPSPDTPSGEKGTVLRHGKRVDRPVEVANSRDNQPPLLSYCI